MHGDGLACTDFAGKRPDLATCLLNSMFGRARSMALQNPDSNKSFAVQAVVPLGRGFDSRRFGSRQVALPRESGGNSCVRTPPHRRAGRRSRLRKLANADGKRALALLERTVSEEWNRLIRRGKRPDQPGRYGGRAQATAGPGAQMSAYRWRSIALNAATLDFSRRTLLGFW